MNECELNLLTIDMAFMHQNSSVSVRYDMVKAILSSNKTGKEDFSRHVYVYV